MMRKCETGRLFISNKKGDLFGFNLKSIGHYKEMNVLKDNVV